MLMQWGESDVPASVHRSTSGQTLERHVVEETVTWMGPLPPPSAVRQYEAILPGTCERILTLTERQAAHRQWIEREAARIDRRGQAIAAVIGVLAIVCGTYLMATDQDAWGFATIVTAIAGLVGASVFSRRLQDQGSRGHDSSPSSGGYPSSHERAERRRARGSRPGR